MSGSVKPEADEQDPEVAEYLKKYGKPGAPQEEEDPVDAYLKRFGPAAPKGEVTAAPLKPIAIPARPPIAATDAARVGPEGVGLEEQLRNEHPDLVTATAQGVAGMVEHPIETARTLAETPFKGGEAVGEYVKGGRLNKGKGRAAAIGAAQTAAMLFTGPAEGAAEPIVARAIGDGLAPLVTRTAIGAVSGATFTPDRPAVGGLLGAAGGALSSHGAAARDIQDRIARFEQLAREHPDWLTEQPSTPAEAETRTSRTLANPNGPKATATAEAMPSDEQPDFTVEDPVRELGPFKGALIEHGRAFSQASDRAETSVQPPSDQVQPPSNTSVAPAPQVESPQTEAPQAVTPKPVRLAAGVRAPEGQVVSVPGKSLQLDPSRFQFKTQGIDAGSGAAPWVKGAKRYNPVLGGVWVTWIDPADGKEYVVNSHHRKAIYDNDTSAGRPDNVNVLRIEAPDAASARAVGARINIAEGHGTPLDVGQFIRDSGLSAGDLEKEGISLRGDLAQKGTALSQLAPDLMAKVGTGELQESHGVAIGDMLAGEPELQREVAAEVKRAKVRLSADDVREVARQVKAAGTEDVRQDTLFGGEVGRKPLFVERARLASSILKKLGADRRVLGYVADQNKAQILARGGNVIDVERSRELAGQSAQLEELFQRLYTRDGPIAKVLTQAAGRVARGEAVRAVTDDIYGSVATAVQTEIQGGYGSGAHPREAEGSRGVSPSTPEAGGLLEGEPKPEPDPNQEDVFGVGEDRPEYRSKRNAVARDKYRADRGGKLQRDPARKKELGLAEYHKSANLANALDAAGVGYTQWSRWRSSDPDFRERTDAIKRAHADNQTGRALRRKKAEENAHAEAKLEEQLRYYREHNKASRARHAPERRGIDHRSPEAKSARNERKKTAIEVYELTGNVAAATKEAGVMRTRWYHWLEQDPSFRERVVAADRKRMRTDIDALKDHVKELRTNLERAGAFLTGRDKRAFNSEAAAIVKSIDTAKALKAAREEIDDLADDFTPIEGREKEQKQLREMFNSEEIRRAGLKRDAFGLSDEEREKAEAHRARQARYEAKKAEKTAAPAPLSEAVLRYRAEKAARAARVGEDRAPYESGEQIDKPAVRIRKTGKVVQGYTHPHAIQRAIDAGKLPKNYWKHLEKGGLDQVDDGFTTTHGRFVSREEAYEIADRADQLRDKLPNVAKLYPEHPMQLDSMDVKDRERPMPGKKYDHASTQINLPQKTAAAIIKLGNKIPNADLAEDGREAYPHITVKYGLHGNDPDAVRKLLENEAPFDVELGKTSYFPNGESGNGDVVKVDVDSPALHALNKKIADALPNTETHPTYKPHATIAFVKPGLGEKYSGQSDLVGRKVRVSSVVFSDRNGEQTRIKLGGEESLAVGEERNGYMQAIADLWDRSGPNGRLWLIDKWKKQHPLEKWEYRWGAMEVEELPLHVQQALGTERAWEIIMMSAMGVKEDLFGYGKPEQGGLLPEDAGTAAQQKKRSTSFEKAAKDAEAQVEFLRKQLTRMGDDPKYVGKTGKIRETIAELERIANFSKKVTTEEIKLNGKERGEDTDSLDMFGVKEGEHIQPNKLTALVMQLESLSDDIMDRMREQDGMLSKLEELEPKAASSLRGRQLSALRGEFRGLHAGMDRITKDLTAEGRQVEKTGIASRRFISLTHEWNGLTADYEKFVDRLNQLRTQRETKRMTGESFQWEEGRPGYAPAPVKVGQTVDFDVRGMRRGKIVEQLPDENGQPYFRILEQLSPGHVESHKVGLARINVLRGVKEDERANYQGEKQLELAFGSKEKVAEVAADVVKNSGQYVTIAHANELGQKVLSTRQREKNLATARKRGAWVSILGKKFSGPHELAQLLYPFRSPETENFSVIYRGEDGTILHHSVESSGAIDYVQVANNLADRIEETGKQVGSVDVDFAHNHPSGNVIGSKYDKRLTVQLHHQLAQRGITLHSHVIINHKVYTWMKPVESSASGEGSIEIAEGAPFDPPAMAEESDWTQGHGATADSPWAIAAITAEVKKGDVAILYTNRRGEALALEPRPASSLENLAKWMPEQLKALAADQLAIVFDPGTHGDVVQQVRAIAKLHPEITHNLLDVSSFDGSRSIRAEYGRELNELGKQVPIIPQPAKRLLGEERKSYGEGSNDAEGAGEGRPAGENGGLAAEPGRLRRSASGSRKEIVEGQEQEESSVAEPPSKYPDPAGLTQPRSSFRPTELPRAIQSLFHPESLGPAARGVAGTIRHRINAESFRRLAVANEQLRAFKKVIDKLPRDRQVDVWDAAEQGLSTGDKDLDQGIQLLHDVTQDFTDDLIALDRLKAEAAIENYVGRFWSKPKNQRGVDFMAAIMGRRPFEGPKSFLKKRSIEFFKEGLDAGLTPATYNFVESQLAKIAEMQRVIAAEHTLRAEEKSGRAKKVMLGTKPPIDPHGDPWVKIDRAGNDPAFIVYGPRQGGVKLPPGANVKAGEVEVYGPRPLGAWYAPRDAAAVWSAHLSRGLRGNPIYDAMMAPAQASAQILLGFSGFHFTTIAREGVNSSLALALDDLVNKHGDASRVPGHLKRAPAAIAADAAFGRRIMQQYRDPGAHPALEKVLQHMMAGGYRGTAESELWTGERLENLKRAFNDAVRGQSKGRQLWGASRLPLNALWAGIELQMKPLMGMYVPWMKTAATYRAVAQALGQLPPGSSMDHVHQVMGDIVKEMDYRYGQVQYDNHFIPRVIKNIAQLVFLAPGWTFGTLTLAGRGIGQAGSIPYKAWKAKGVPDELIGKSAAYWIGGVLFLALVNGILTYMHTGEEPSGKDFFAYRDGTSDDEGNPNRHILPGYEMHDIYSWSHHAASTFTNKLSPALAFMAKLAQNRTYFGDMVYDPDASLPVKAKQIAKQAAENLGSPLSYQNYREASRRGENNMGEVARNAFGITPAKREFIRSDAQNKLAEILSRRGHTALTPDQAEVGRAKAELRLAKRERKPKGSAIADAMRAAPLSHREAAEIWRGAGTDKLLGQFKQLTYPEAKEVWDVASPDERRRWHAVFITKRENYRTQHGAAALRKANGR